MPTELQVSSLPDLARRFSRAIEKGKGIRLEAADLDLLCSTGVLAALTDAAAAEQQRQAAERLAARVAAPPSLARASDADASIGTRAAEAMERARRRRG